MVDFIQPCKIFPTKRKILNLAVKFYGMKFCMKFLRTAVSGCLRPRPRELCPSSERRTRGAVLCTQQHRRWLHSAPQRRVGPVRSLWSSQQSDQAAAARQSCRGNARTLLHPARHEQTFNRDSIAKYKGVKRKANNIKCSVR